MTYDQKLGQVEELLHQLNNDLTLIMGQLELAAMAAGDDVPPKFLKKVEAARTAADRMASHVLEAQTTIKSGKG